MQASPDEQQLTALFAPARALEIAPDELDAARGRVPGLRSEQPAPARGWTRSWRAPSALALPMLCVAAVVLLLAGAFSGPARTGAQPALAAVIRAVERTAPLRPGTIDVATSRQGYPANSTVETVTETPTGPGPQNSLNVTSDPRFGMPAEQAVSDGDEQVYLKSTNTIYISSIWGPHITKGTKPGTFTYTPAKQPTGSKMLQPKPLTLTAQQEHALLNGIDTIDSIPIGSRPPYPQQLQVAPAKRPSAWPQALRWMLRSRQLRIVGLTTLKDRSALELTSPRSGGHVHDNPGHHATIETWVDPKTYLPIKLIIQSGQVTVTQTWLPITPANERLLSLTARHPNARIDRNHRDFLKAAHGYAILAG